MDDGVKLVWSTYLHGLTTRDPDVALKMHDSEAVLRIVETRSGAATVAAGSQLRDAMAGFQQGLDDLSTFMVMMQEIDLNVIPQVAQIFASWRCPSSGIHDATETLLVDMAQGSILSHNIVVTR
eukprot:TRINITY_DN51996_c0_g1_i1.p2 TRINITY_DN51996_c0_g1~~TRINITY_DN51996_c0_g1_i1.p2  ORF type:complete len:143 (+),score=22.36 TRINITY_DN51996_c0_g1_i1:58-429(+)